MEHDEDTEVEQGDAKVVYTSVRSHLRGGAKVVYKGVRSHFRDKPR